MVVDYYWRDGYVILCSLQSNLLEDPTNIGRPIKRFGSFKFKFLFWNISDISSSLPPN